MSLLGLRIRRHEGVGVDRPCGPQRADWSERAEGWGVLDSPETPGGCWGHFSHIQTEGFRALSPGQQVDLQWEAPGFKQDGYDYRAVNIVPRPA
ncbi:cold shock domain-containing protein [Streptomyces sp. NPDC046197]|uniref:cold shock domain-containing protein n=1 Tax=Streptomyces sp. NPDC046197 TaxID=3154337 RepID=UPI0033E70952